MFFVGSISFQEKTIDTMFQNKSLLKFWLFSCYKGRFRGRVYNVATSWDLGGASFALLVYDKWHPVKDTNFEGNFFRSGGECNIGINVTI